MNLDRLEVGMVLKSYKALCEILDEKVLGGCSKKSQIKEWERYFKYEKQGNKFIIKEIFAEVKNKLDNRSSGNNSIYAENVEKLIIHMCSNTNRTEKEFKLIEISTNVLLKNFDMINNNYVYGRDHMNKFSRYLEVPIETLYDFYNTTSKKNKDIVEGGLNRLQNRCLINWSTIIKICTKNGTSRTATNSEIVVITEIEQLALQELKLESKQDVFLKGRWKDFRKIVSDELKKHTNIKYYYNAYKILTTKKFREKIMEGIELENTKLELNNDVVSSCIKSAEKRHIKIYNEYNNNENTTLKGKRSFGKPIYDRESNRLLDRYVEDTEQITALVIDSSCQVKLEYEFKSVEDKVFKFDYLSYGGFSFEEAYELF